MATTDVNGHYEFTGLVDGSYTVTPTLAGYVFTADHEDVTIAGDYVVADDMVGSVVEILPQYIGFEDAVVPAVDAAWTNTGSGTWATMAIAADSNSYTPSEFTKAARGDISSLSLVLGRSLDPLPSSGKLRVALLMRNGAGTLNETRIGIGTNVTNGSGALDFASGAIDTNANPDACRVSAYNSNTETIGINSNSGLNLSPTRWKWVRLEIDIDASTITCQHYQPEDDTAGTARTASFADCGGWTYSSTGMNLVIFQPSRAGVTDIQYAGFFIGTGSDAWPT